MAQEQRKSSLRTSPQRPDRLSYAGERSPSGKLILQDEAVDAADDIAVGNRMVNLPLLHAGLAPHLCCASEACGAKGTMVLALKGEGERGFAGVLV